MRISIAIAVVMSLAFGAQSRGVVSKVSPSRADATGKIQFTVEGRNPCGAVHIDYGDGHAVTHPIERLPVTIPHEYTQTGEYLIHAQGMGNCDESVSAKVRVDRVRSQPQKPLPNPDRRGRSTTTFVDSREEWTDTGIDVRAGDALIIDASGMIQFMDQGPPTGPNGAPGQRASDGAPMPSALVGALVARVGNSAPFLVGARSDGLRAPRNGALYLRVNDGLLDDNRGSFRVTVSVTRGKF